MIPALATTLRRHAAFLLLLVPVSAWYFWLTWYDGLGSLKGDGLIYLSTARHYAPYVPAHPLDAAWASVTQFPPLFAALLAATGGAVDFRLAHAATAGGLLLGIVAFYAWLVVALELPRRTATLGAAFLALAPGTFMLSLHIYPEGLYLALAFAALAALARGENTGRAAWFWAAAAAIGAAILTRTVGMMLLPALLLVLARRRPPRWPAIVALAIAPMLAWNAVHDPPMSYTDALKEEYLGAPLPDVVASVAASVESAALGLLVNVSQNRGVLWLVLALGAAVGAASLWRFARLQADAWYLLAYLATLAIWPYPVEGPRLAWVVVPILLGYLLWLGECAARRAPGPRAAVAMRWAPVAALALLLLPEFALLAARAVHPLARVHPEYRHYPQWYDPALGSAHGLTEMHVGVAESFRRFAARIPDEECFFSTLQDLASFYMRRPGQTPPAPSVDDATFERELREAGCRYFVFAIASASEDEPVLYPLARVRDRIEILEVRRMRLPGDPVVAILGELRRP